MLFPVSTQRKYFVLCTYCIINKHSVARYRLLKSSFLSWVKPSEKRTNPQFQVLQWSFDPGHCKLGCFSTLNGIVFVFSKFQGISKTLRCWPPPLFALKFSLYELFATSYGSTCLKSSNFVNNLILFFLEKKSPRELFSRHYDVF